ncbi:MAG: hypothetical protein NTU53_19365 [Planctomycetota bacterium]|nr:hypothetical protein [Planctomycetota bacterium]
MGLSIESVVADDRELERRPFAIQVQVDWETLPLKEESHIYLVTTSVENPNDGLWFLMGSDRGRRFYRYAIPRSATSVVIKYRVWLNEKALGPRATVTLVPFGRWQ